MGAAESKQGGKAQLQKSSTFRFQAIRDQYTTVEQVQRALREAGLESSQLILGIDFTKSNLWTGERTFGNQSLHTISQTPNHYELALVSVARTLKAFDDDNMIPVFGFGDTTTADRNVFSFFPNGRPANGLEEALFRYRTIAPLLRDRLSGPTTFAPLIYEALKVVAATGQYHILVIVADGQVSEGVHTAQTIQAIVDASQFPLSIVMIGVGDGPWEMMKAFDDLLPERAFDNFQFVALTSVVRDWAQLASNRERLEAEFALRALMEVPEQFKTIKRLGYLGKSYMQPMHPALLKKPEFALGPPPDVAAFDAANGQQ